MVKMAVLSFCAVIGLLFCFEQIHCMPNSFQGQHIQGGVIQNSPWGIHMSIDRCLQTCNGNCRGADYNYRFKTCWHHTAATECNPLIDKPNCIHFRFMSCGGGDNRNSNIPASVVSIENTHILGGTQILSAVSLIQCYNTCQQSSVCYGFDWDTWTTECFVHLSTTECDPLEQKEGCTHYRVRGSCGTRAGENGCTDRNVAFKDYFGFNRQGGSKIADRVTFEECKQLCRNRGGCRGVDWDVVTKGCYEHTSIGEPIANNCCRHSKKLCLDMSTVVPPMSRNDITPPPTTPSPKPTTSLPPLIVRQTIRDDGKCPSRLQKFEDYSTPGGSEVPDDAIQTAEQCKQWCLDNVLICGAVDFNKITTNVRKCYFHQPGTDFVATAQPNTCCTQFRVINCMPKQCVVHPPVISTTEITLPNNAPSLFVAIEDIENLDVSNPNPLAAVTFQDCEGVCVVNSFRVEKKKPDGSFQVDPNSERMYERTCNTNKDPTVYSNKNCETSRVADPLTGLYSSISSCSCSADKCNAFGAGLTEMCIAHYPMDCHTLDLTNARRNGDGVGIKFEGVDVAKNWSASFDGTNYIQVDSFAYTVLGTLGTSASFTRTPELSVSLWVKFTEILGQKMTLLSNGDDSTATLVISSDYQDTTMRTLTARVSIDGEEYSVDVSVPYDKWIHVIMQVTPQPDIAAPSGMEYLQLEASYDLDTATPTTNKLSVETLVDSVQTGSGITIDPSGNPLCIGKQYVPDNPNAVFSFNRPGNYLVGLLDEVWIFAGPLTQAKMEAIRSVSYDPNRFVP